MEPPGQARSDLAIWLDFARRMEFRDNDGAPLVRWEGAESAYNELTITGWDAVSTQPLLEAGAVSPRKVP